MSSTTPTVLPTPPSLHFAVAPQASRLLRARERIRDYVTLYCAGQRLIDDVVLAVEEACTNAIRHSGSDEDIDITLAFRDHDLRIAVSDRGSGFDVETFDPGELPDPMLDHGRGLFLMSRLCDELELRGERGTIVRMTKRDVLTQAPPGLEQGFMRHGAGHAAGYWRHREQVLLEEMAEAFATLDWEYRVSYANGAALEFFGMCLPEVVGTSFWDIFPQTRHMAVGDGVRRAMELGQSSIEEYLSPTVGRWVECRIYPASSGVSLYVRGIDERKRKELERDELLRAQRRRAALDAYRVKLGDALRDLDDAVQIKATAARILGEQLGADRVVYLEVDADGQSVLAEAAYGSGASAGRSVRLRVGDYSSWVAGELRAGRQVAVHDVELTPHDLPNARALAAALQVHAFVACPLVKGGRLAAILAVTQATTRQWSVGEQEQIAETAERLWAAAGSARAEAARRAAEEHERYLADVIESGDVPFAARRPTGELVLFNQAFAELVGYSREELEADATGLAVELTPPEWWQAETPLLARAVTEKRPVRYEKEYVRHDGSRVPVEVFAQPVFAADGTLLQYRSFVTDVTERKRAERAQVVAAEQAGVLSEDLRDSLREQTALTERVQLELARTRLLQDLAVAASTELDLATMADKALDALRAHLRLAACDIRRLDDGGLRLVASFGDAGPAPDIDVRHSALLAARAVRQRRTLSHEDLTPGPETAATLAGRTSADERYVHVPIAHHGEVKGLLSLAFTGKRPFRPGELALFEAAARIVGQAMENARLLEAEHEATLLAVALARIDQVLHSSLDVDDIVARALEEGGQGVVGRRRHGDAAEGRLLHGDLRLEHAGRVRGRRVARVAGAAGRAGAAHTRAHRRGRHRYRCARLAVAHGRVGHQVGDRGAPAAAGRGRRRAALQLHIRRPPFQSGRDLLRGPPGRLAGRGHGKRAPVRPAAPHRRDAAADAHAPAARGPRAGARHGFGHGAGGRAHRRRLQRCVRARRRPGGHPHRRCGRQGRAGRRPHRDGARSGAQLRHHRPGAARGAGQSQRPAVARVGGRSARHGLPGAADLATGRLVYASAGHPAPVHLAAASCVVLGADYGPPLGAFPTAYKSRETVLARGDCLVLYSDGVTEARRDGHLFGDERLVQSVADSRGRAAQQVADDLERRVRAFARRLDDDLQIVVVRLA